MDIADIKKYCKDFGYGQLEFEGHWIAINHEQFHQRLPLKSQQILREVAATTIGSALGLSGDELERFAKCAADNSADKTVVNEVANAFKSVREDPRYSDVMMATAIVDAISDVQDTYRKGLVYLIEAGYGTEVFKNTSLGATTPIELSGVGLASDHFKGYVEKILKQLQYKADWRCVTEVYYDRCLEFMKDLDTNNPSAQYNGLQGYLQQEYGMTPNECAIVIEPWLYEWANDTTLRDRLVAESVNIKANDTEWVMER